MTVYCLKYAESTLPESMVFDGGSREKKIPIAFKEKAKAFIEKYSDPQYCVHTCHSISLKTERIL